jgi:uncharacterized surface protein with fasciclin (FAS1) repeats
LIFIFHFCCVFVFVLFLCSAALLLRTGLFTELNVLNSHSYTVLAPIDSAFDHLPGGSYWMEYMLQDEPEVDYELLQIVKFHMIPRVVTTADLTDGDGLSTLQDAAGISVFRPYGNLNDSIYFNFGQLVDADIVVSSGKKMTFSIDVCFLFGLFSFA